MNKHRDTLATLLEDVSADVVNAIREMPPNSGGSMGTQRAEKWKAYQKLKGLQEALTTAMEHLTD